MLNGTAAVRETLAHAEMLIESAWAAVTSGTGNAEAAITEARKASEQAGYEAGAVECDLIKARHIGEMDQYADALRMAGAAHGKYEASGNLQGQARACRVLGFLYARHGNFNKALENLFYALKLIKDNALQISEGYYPIDVFLMNNIAFIYAETGRTAEALKFFYEAFDIARPGGGSMTATILTNIAEMHLNSGDMEMALRYNRMALTEVLNQNLGYGDIHNCYNSFGLIYGKMGQHENAIESFRKALEAAENAGSKYNRIVSSIAMARLHLDYKEGPEALRTVEAVRELAEEIEANKLLANIMLVKAQASEETRDLAGALQAYKSYMELNNELSTLEVEERLNNYTAEFTAERAAKDAEIYRLKNTELRLKSEELEASNRSLTIISEIGRKITASLDVSSVLSIAHESIARLTDADMFAIGLYDRQSETLEFRMIMEGTKNLPAKLVCVGGSDALSRCVHSQRELAVADAGACSEDEFIGIGLAQLRSYICLPLVFAHDTIGVLCVQSLRSNAFTANDMAAIRSLASYVAIALNNAQKSEELRQKASELEKLSRTDPLTGLYNRRFIIDKMQDERTRFRRYSKDFAIAIADIDDFKKVNDAWGHDCGDFVLTEVSRRMKSQLREQDCIARWGGEEFLILLPETDIAGAEALTQRLKNAVQDTVFEYRKKHISITITVGLCAYRAGISIDDAIMKADNALYEGKNRGRNCVVISL